MSNIVKFGDKAINMDRVLVVFLDDKEGSTHTVALDSENPSQVGIWGEGKKEFDRWLSDKQGDNNPVLSEVYKIVKQISIHNLKTPTKKDYLFLIQCHVDTGNAPGDPGSSMVRIAATAIAYLERFGTPE